MTFRSSSTGAGMKVSEQIVTAVPLWLIRPLQRGRRREAMTVLRYRQDWRYDGQDSSHHRRPLSRGR